MGHPDIIAIADGRLFYERFRGRNKHLLVRNAAGEYEPLQWYDRSLALREGEQRPEEVPPERQGIEYSFDPEIFRKILAEVTQQRANLSTLLLINSYGGRIGTETLMQNLTDYTREGGGTVAAYVTTVAVSAGSAIMQEADEINVLKDTWTMWHLPAFPATYRDYIADKFGADNVDEVIARHNDMRHALHRNKLEKLAKRALPQFQNDIRADIEKVMAAKNVRHELSFSGSQLHTFGIAQNAYDDVSRLENAVRERFSIDYEDRDWTNNPISKFFLFSRVEEKLRAKNAMPLKIIQLRDGSFFLQESSQNVERFAPMRAEAQEMVWQEMERASKS